MNQLAQRADEPGLVVTHACPRCRYAGSGESYFARGTNVAKLLGVTVLTSGIGAPVYYLLRHSHQICPRCGMNWGEKGRRSSLVRAPAAQAREAELVPPGRSERSLKRGTFVLYTLAALLAGGGAVQGDVGQMAAGVGAGAGGYVMQRNLRQARERRRQMLLDSLVPPVLRLAAQHGGRLTVSDVAAGLGWTLPRATKVLQYLDDGVRVDSQVTDEGMIVFEFRELIGRGVSDVRGELLA
ncbi:hypothetical protein BH23GEM5_BH23GEM5_17000 [soil metagenome]